MTEKIFIIYMFCTSREPAIILPVVQIKTKTILGLQLVQNISYQIMKEKIFMIFRQYF